MRVEPFPNSISATSDLALLSDDDLLRRLSELLKRSRRVEAELVAHIGEADERRLYAREASPSMFAYCTDVLHLSEHEAYLRITVARAARVHPVLLAMLADARLHLSGVAKLAPHLTEANLEAVLARAAHKTKRQVEELIAELAPRPDVPQVMRKLPATLTTTPRTGLDAEVQADNLELGPDRAAAVTLAALPRSAVVQPLAAERYKIQFTASGAFREKLERLQALMQHTVPDGDLARVLEEAVTEKLERLEARRFAKTKAPRTTLEHSDTSASRSRRAPAAVRRAVYGRDDARCRFVGSNGRSCGARDWLEFDHVQAHARGGDRSVENIRLMCRAHNACLAERAYGKEAMQRYRKAPGRKPKTLDLPAG